MSLKQVTNLNVKDNFFISLVQGEERDLSKQCQKEHDSLKEPKEKCKNLRSGVLGSFGSF